MNQIIEKATPSLLTLVIRIFPSHLEHSVEKNWSTERRYSLAFNFYVRGDFGKEEYELQLK